MRARVSVKGREIGEFNDVKVGMSLAMQLEDATGWTVPELVEQVGRASGRGLQAFVWFTQLQAGVPNPERHMEFTFEEFKLDSIDEEGDDAGKAPGPVKAVKAA
jgi:hypothetical protein